MHQERTYQQRDFMGENQPLRCVQLRLVRPTPADVETAQAAIRGFRRGIPTRPHYPEMWARYSVWELSEYDPIGDHIAIAHAWIKNAKPISVSCKYFMLMNDTQQTALAHVELEPDFLADLARLRLPFWASVDLLEYGCMSPDPNA